MTHFFSIQMKHRIDFKVMIQLCGNKTPININKLCFLLKEQGNIFTKNDTFCFSSS
jgi:hypothetical protein